MQVNLKTDAPSDRELAKRGLQRIANAVESEEHWRRILDAAGPEQRDELERVVGPLLRFRRSSPCTTPDCESGKAGEYQPVLEVVSATDATDIFHVPIELKLCEDCQKGAVREDFLTDALWAQVIMAWPSSEYPPLRSRTRLRFDRVH